MEVDALLLSRLQAAAQAGVHIVFPSLAVGLAGYLAVLEALWLGSGNKVFETLYGFWLKIFAVSSALCVVALATLWAEMAAGGSPLAATVAPLLAPRYALALLAALLLEAGLLAVMLWGWRRIDLRLHLAATVLAAIGALLLSAGLIAAAGGMEPTPSPGLPSRFAHLALAAYLTTALVVGAASAWRLLKDPEEIASATALRMAVGLVAIAAPLQLVTGGGWQGGEASTPETSRAYLVMVGLGVAMIGLGVWGAWLSWRNRLERARAYLVTAMAMAPSGFVCIVAGWSVTEGGRRVPAAHDLWVAPGAVMAPISLLGALALHGLILGLGALYLLRRIGEGPGSGEPPDAAPR